MDKKLKKMERVLLLASFFVMIANISLFRTDLIENYIIKGVIGFIIPSILLFLSFEVENSLKLKSTSRIIQLMSMFSYFVTMTAIYYEIINHLDLIESFIKFGPIYVNIEIFVSLFAILVSLIGLFINKDELYKKIIILVSLYSIYFLLNSIVRTLDINFLGMTSSNHLLEFVILTIVFLLYNEFLKIKYSKCLSIANLFYTIYLLDLTFNKETIIPAILISSLAIIAYIIRIRKEESKCYDVIPFIGIMLILLNMLLTYDESIIILPLMMIILTDMLIVVFDVVKDKKEGFTFKIFLDLLTMIALVISMNTNQEIVLCTLIIIASSITSTFALKSDYHEQYILPFKTILCIIALLVKLNQSIDIDYMLIVLIINILAVLGSLISKDKLFKDLFLIITGITLLFFTGISTIYRFLIVISMFIFDYIVLVICDKRPASIKYILDIMFIIFLLDKMSIFDYSLIYLIASICFIGLYLISNERPLKVISLISFAISTNYFIRELPISLDTINTLTEVIPVMVLYYLCSTSKNNNYFIIKTLLIIFNTFALAFELNTPVSVLVCLAMNVLFVITNIKNNNIVYKTSFVLTIVSIFFALGLIDEVPTFVYMLLLGLVIMVFIYRKIKMFINEPHEEEEIREYKVNYCGECGNKLTSDMKFCPKCGNKLKK